MIIPDFGPADVAVKAACERFSGTFGLRGYPDMVFRVCESISYVSQGQVMLYVQRQWSCEEYRAQYGREPSDLARWCDFGKGTAAELERELVR